MGATFIAHHTLINNNMAEECCPRCNEIKIWEHAVKRKARKKHRKEFVEKLLEEMLKNKLKTIVVEEMLNMIEDTLRRIEEDEEDEHKTNKETMRFQHFF